MTILKNINKTYVHDSIEPVTLKLKLVQNPEFSGHLQDWPTFSELFNSLIINNRTSNDVQKMQYLKTSLAGNAAKVIEQLEIIGDYVRCTVMGIKTRLFSSIIYSTESYSGFTRYIYMTICL